MMANEEYLRKAEPHLIVRIDPQTNGQIKPTPRIDEVERGWDEVVDEGYDPGNSPLGPVYWRAVTRGEEQMYLSTFVASRDFIINAWGPRGLDYCDPITGTAGCCARAASGHAAVAPSSDMNSRRLSPRNCIRYS